MEANFNLNFDFLDDIALDPVSLTQLDHIATQSLMKVEKQTDTTTGSSTPAATSTRFIEPLTTSGFEQSLKDRIPQKTQQATGWAVRVYSDWKGWRSTKNCGEPFWPIPNLQDGSLPALDYWLARFITEIKRRDGTDYPPNTLKSIASGVQRHMQEDCNRRDINIFQKSDTSFKTFRSALQSRTKQLLSKGVGVSTKHKDPVTSNDEQTLWDTNVFSTGSGQGLSYCVFFYNCKVFGLRGMDEHVHLMTDQFIIGRDENQDKFLEFSGRISKTLTGDIDCKAVPKKIRQYADPNHPRCIVKVFELYLSLVPEGRFYRRPLPNKGKEIYFSVQPVGLNSLKKYVQLMFRDAGIDWKAQNRNISNHSGKVTCCTRLYEKGFDEQSIAGRSGHRSDAIRVYKRPSHQLLKEVSNALQPPRPQPIEPTVPITPPPKLHKEETETKPKENPVKEEKNVEEKNVLSMVVPAGIDTVVLERNGKKLRLTFDF